MIFCIIYMVKMALLEKEIAFEVVDLRGSQDESFLKMSPMGKVPCIETEQGFLSETNVILEYLEDLGTGPNLMPADPYERAKVRELMDERGAQLTHIDAVIMAQRPKLAPYIDGMREVLAETLRVEIDKVSLKATTTERLGFVGREEGMAAQAVAMLEI